MDGEADIDVLELIRLWLPILIGSLPIAIVKVVNKVRRSYEIGAFDYKVVAPDSEMNQIIEDENKLRRAELYK